MASMADSDKELAKRRGNTPIRKTMPTNMPS